MTLTDYERQLAVATDAGAAVIIDAIERGRRTCTECEAGGHADCTCPRSGTAPHPLDGLPDVTECCCGKRRQNDGRVM